MSSPTNPKEKAAVISAFHPTSIDYHGRLGKKIIKIVRQKTVKEGLCAATNCLL
jgi:hypothetical protein